MRRPLIAVTLLGVLSVSVAAQQRRSGLPAPPAASPRELSVPPDRLDRLARWMKAVDRHEPGEDDDEIAEIGAWTNEEVADLWIDVTVLARVMRNLRLGVFTVPSDSRTRAPIAILYRPPQLQRLRVLACAAGGRLVDRECIELQAARSLDEDLLTLAAHASAERERTGDTNYLLKRAALLHADIAMFSPRARMEPLAEPHLSDRALGPQSWRVGVSDGRGTDAGMIAIHWDIARLALDHVRPPTFDKPAPERDDMVRAWYRATAAWMQLREDHDPKHLDRGRQIFPDDADLAFLSGCQRETYAGPAIQAAARSIALPLGMTVGIESARTELRQAESFFRRAIALRPAMGEAHLRLGRVLALSGRHADAAAEIQASRPLLDVDDLRYYAELFAGAEHEALGAFDAARAAYQRAAALFPLAQSPYVALSELAHRRGDCAAAAAAIERVFALPAALDGNRDDPWWRYHLAQARNADDLLEAVRAPFLREPRN